MRWARWITLVWPGLTQLWFSGTLWGLAVGCGFAWLVNLAVVSTFVWTELIGPWSRIGVWGLLVVVWAGSLSLSFRQLRLRDPAEIRAKAEDLFRRAQGEYLSGNWIGAEQLLAEILRIDRQDVDARILLVSLLRRTGQLAEAADQLRRLEVTEGSEKWRSEIERERRLLEQQFTRHIADQQTDTIEVSREDSKAGATNQAA
jgi:transcriptional antiterminator Rof (Rho-off)